MRKSHAANLVLIDFRASADKFNSIAYISCIYDDDDHVSIERGYLTDKMVTYSIQSRNRSGNTWENEYYQSSHSITTRKVDEDDNGHSF